MKLQNAKAQLCHDSPLRRGAKQQIKPALDLIDFFTFLRWLFGTQGHKRATAVGACLARLRCNFSEL